MNVNKMNTKVKLNPTVCLLSLICALNFYACTPEDDPTEPDVNCLAMPSCGPGQTEVEQCDESTDSCDEVSMCGVTLFCADDANEGLPDGAVCFAEPNCAMDEVEVETCDEGDEDCYENTVCETTIYCTVDASEDEDDGEDTDEEVEVTCRAVPSCGPDQVMVESCDEADDSCQEVSICEQTIFCTDSAE